MSELSLTVVIYGLPILTVWKRLVPQ